MEELTTSQFLLIIDGPSCAGKSTTADVLLSKYSGIFHAKSDALKWLISGYHAPTHHTTVSNMTLSVAKIALTKGLSVLKEGGLYQVEQLIDFCTKRDISVFVANIEAPKKVLLERFQLRVEAKKKGGKISNTSEQRLRELYDMYQESKMKTTLTFNSSTQSPEEITHEITSHIRDN